MKNTVVLLIIIVLLASCYKSDSPEFLNHNWKQGDRVWIKDGMFNSYTHFDPKTKKMVGDSLIPIEVLSDSLFVITNIGPKGKFNDDLKFIPNRDTVYTDTVTYEVREFKGTKLLFYPVNEKYYATIYELEVDANLPTHITKDIVEFQVAGYSIGDTIDRDLLEIQDTRNYSGMAIEIAELKNNKDVQVNLIGDKYIHEIIQRGISKYDLDDVKAVVSHKMGFKPKHKATSKAGEYNQEYYDWDKNGVSITLQRMEYTGDDPMKKLVNDNDWTLYYRDNITLSLLESEFADGTPKSSIIN